jgi:hypothetical protein
VLRREWVLGDQIDKGWIRQGVGRQKSVRPLGRPTFAPLRFGVAASNRTVGTDRYQMVPAGLGAPERLFG